MVVVFAPLDRVANDDGGAMTVEKRASSGRLVQAYCPHAWGESERIARRLTPWVSTSCLWRQVDESTDHKASTSRAVSSGAGHSKASQMREEILNGGTHGTVVKTTPR
jgi:hypothetical protein